jgi:hypothetical protein
MRHSMTVAWLVGVLGAMPVGAQEPVVSGPPSVVPQVGEMRPAPEPGPVASEQDALPHDVSPGGAAPWQTIWGVGGLRAIPDGVKIAPDGAEYHANFSLDANVNFWIWECMRLYMFCDARLWGEKGEYGVTNSRDGFFGTSKRELDLAGGAAWNYYGFLEVRATGYTNNNLNRGSDPILPRGFTDGFWVENRYYLASEYSNLGRVGYDVAKATFLSVGFYPTKDLVGNDGKTFQPGLLLRAYLTYDLGDWPVYVYGDASYISQRDFSPKLWLYDVGVAVRPLPKNHQWEFRAGVEGTGDFQVSNVKSLVYVAWRYVF